MYLALELKKGGGFSPLTGTIVLRNNVIPTIALIFKGRPATSKLISAMVIVKNKTAMISGLVIRMYKNIPPAKASKIVFTGKTYKMISQQKIKLLKYFF
jgi:hypothetical protein